MTLNGMLRDSACALQPSSAPPRLALQPLSVVHHLLSGASHPDLYPSLNSSPSMRSSKPSKHAVIGASLGFAGLPLAMPSSADSEIMCEGWVLKKRRKKMQGFARRYFILYHSGVLAYAFEPGQPIRDHIYLQHAAISTAPGRKDIHVDSNTATFHIKCLSTEDFDAWMSGFRKFIALGVEARKSATMRHATRQSTATLHKSGAIAEEMGTTITQLEESIMSLARELPHKKHGSMGKKPEKDKAKEHSKFALFKRPPSQHSFTQEFGSEFSADGTSSDTTSAYLQRTKTVLQSLKAQHATLVKSLQVLTSSPYADPGQSTQTSPLPYTSEEEEYPAESVDRSPRLTSTLTRISNRNSIATTVSDSIHEWFDALDDNGGPEEFFMDVHATPEHPSHIMIDDSRSSLEPPDTSSIDTDLEDVDTPDKTISSHTQAESNLLNVVRRTQLPALPVGDEGSLFAILKKNVGKDLSTITFPVTFNEPLTLLQRAAEELEYYGLLDQAARAEDPINRISYVAAFAVSGYAHTRHRSGRKAFNPMLAETFEDVRMKLVAEKVRHNPLEIAYHAEGENWELCATSCGKTKFWGKSLEIIPLGTNRLRVGSDHYVWKKPSSFMRNLMVGTKYFEHCGKMTIENTTTKMTCVLDFKQNGYWGPSNVVSGTVHSPTGEQVSQLEGKWDDQISQTYDSSHFHVLWRMDPYPKNAHEYYGFTSFSVTLNEITSDLAGKLPPTDSRNRPDVRALENGDLDDAEEQKVRVEELQRDRRKKGGEREPRWFKQVGDDWEYRGGYWEARARDWKDEDIQPLW